MTGETNRWSGRAGFVMASVGSAVGLGSIWKFPYEVGENGGGAFLVFYVLGMMIVVVPLLLAEFVIGRRGGGDALTSIGAVARAHGHSRHWSQLSLVAILGGFLILTYYCVIAGMMLDYALGSVTRGFAGIDAAGSKARFDELAASPTRLAAWQGLFLVVTIAIVSRGVGGGIERACTILMPLLFGLMLLLVLYSLTQGDLRATLAFLFAPRTEALTARTALEALGLGFFSIGVGFGVMVTYAAYTRPDIRLTSAAVIIVVADGVISILAGFAVFPLVFAHGLDPAEGASLVFVTLPIAFGRLAGGDLVAASFFILLFVAALASALSLLELMVAPLVLRFGWTRRGAVWLSGGLVFAGGIPTVLSFNRWRDIRPLAALPGFAKMDVFEAIDAVASNLLLPVAGVFFALFAGRAMPAAAIGAALDLSPIGVRWLRIALRWVVPTAIFAFLTAGLILG